MPILRFFLYWPLLLLVDQLSKIGRTPHPSELRRLYTENLALKAVNEVLRTELHRVQGKRMPLSLGTRAAQVFAYLLTRGNKLFQDSFLGSSPATVRKWATRFRHPFTKPKNRGGRPPIDSQVVEWVLDLKRHNPKWGARRLSNILGRMGIKISPFTVAQILKDHGLDPTEDRRSKWEKWAGTFSEHSLRADGELFGAFKFLLSWLGDRQNPIGLQLIGRLGVLA